MIAKARLLFWTTAKHGGSILPAHCLKVAAGVRDVVEAVALGATQSDEHHGGRLAQPPMGATADAINMPARVSAEADASPMGAVMLRARRRCHARSVQRLPMRSCLGNR
jgi:hypothetical protein